MMGWENDKKMTSLNNSLFEFARRGDLEGIKSIYFSVNLNAKNEKGHSLLMIAAYHGQLEATKFLLSQKADPNFQDQNGNTILMGVAFKGYMPIVRLLIEYGADPKMKNAKDQTALQFAQMFGRTEVANYLTQIKYSMIDEILSWVKSFSKPV